MTDPPSSLPDDSPGSAPIPDTPGSVEPVLTGSSIIVAVTGGIACYKTAQLVSRLVQCEASVRVLMTPGAQRFVTPLTFQSLTGHEVVTGIWGATRGVESPHIHLARWCAAMVIAPATADSIAKIAAGICDDIVSLVACALPLDTPMLIAPAMNADMWANPITQRNIDQLRALRGVHTVGPDTGWQACRSVGPGRMSQPDAILRAIRDTLRHG